MPATRLRRLCPASRPAEVAPRLRPELAIWRYVAPGKGITLSDLRWPPSSAQVTAYVASVVWIPPGVVHRWSDIQALAGDIVLFVPTAPVTPASRDLARGLMTGR